MAKRLSTGQLLAADVELVVVEDEVDDEVDDDVDDDVDEVDAVDAEPELLDELPDEEVSDVEAPLEPFEPRESVR